MVDPRESNGAQQGEGVMDCEICGGLKALGQVPYRGIVVYACGNCCDILHEAYRAGKRPDLGSLR